MANVELLDVALHGPLEVDDARRGAATATVTAEHLGVSEKG